MPVKRVTSRTTNKSTARSNLATARNRVATKVASRNQKSVVGSRPSLSVPVYSLTGRSAGTMSVPKDIFGAAVNRQLLAQAVRVYLTNQQAHWSHTKTRAEIKATTAKVYRQKGSGRARHGARSAPIFIGGGVALGPKSRKVKLKFPKKMAKLALIAALTDKMREQQILGVNLTSATGKTKQLASLFQKLAIRSALISDSQKNDLISRSVRNLQRIDFLPADQLNPYEIVNHQMLILTKVAVVRLEERLLTSKQSALINLKKKGSKTV